MQCRSEASSPRASHQLDPVRPEARPRIRLALTIVQRRPSALATRPVITAYYRLIWTFQWISRCLHRQHGMALDIPLPPCLARALPLPTTYYYTYVSLTEAMRCGAGLARPLIVRLAFLLVALVASYSLFSFWHLAADQAKLPHVISSAIGHPPNTAANPPNTTAAVTPPGAAATPSQTGNAAQVHNPGLGPRNSTLGVRCLSASLRELRCSHHDCVV